MSVTEGYNTGKSSVFSLDYDTNVYNTVHQRRRKLFKTFNDYYEGEHRNNRKGASQKVLNLCGKVVNDSVNFAFGKPIEFETNDEKATEYLNQVWRDNPVTGFSKSSFIKELGKVGSITGTPFVRIHLPTEENPYPTLRIIDSECVDIITDIHDNAKVLSYVVTYKAGGEYYRSEFTYTQIIESKYNAEKRVWDVKDTIPWGYNFLPIMHCQNIIKSGSQWGISDLIDADLNDTINENVNDMARILQLYAYPKTVIQTDSPKKLGNQTDTAIGRTMVIEDKDAKVFNLEMNTDLASSRSFISDIKDAFFQVTNTPAFDAVNVQVGAMSGTALSLLMWPATNKAEDKRGTYGSLLNRINRAILLIGLGKEYETRVIWQDILPKPVKSDLDLIQEKNAKLDLYKRMVDSGIDSEKALSLSGLQ